MHTSQAKSPVPQGCWPLQTPMVRSRSPVTHNFCPIWLWIRDSHNPLFRFDAITCYFTEPNTWPLNQFPDLNQFIDLEPLKWKTVWVLLEKDHITLPKWYTANLSLAFPIGSQRPFLMVSMQKQDQELTVAQIMNSLLPNSDLNWRK